MAPQDLSNMASTVSDIAAKFEEAETKVDATEVSRVQIFVVFHLKLCHGSNLYFDQNYLKL